MHAVLGLFAYLLNIRKPSTINFVCLAYHLLEIVVQWCGWTGAHALATGGCALATGVHALHTGGVLVETKITTARVPADVVCGRLTGQ